jgi:MFS family permease
VGIYILTSAALQPLSGKIYTYFRAKWTYLVFLIIFEIGSLVCALAPSSPSFIAGRAIAGVGGSGLVNGALTIIAGATPLHRRPCEFSAPSVLDIGSDSDDELLTRCGVSLHGYCSG